MPFPRSVNVGCNVCPCIQLMIATVIQQMNTLHFNPFDCCMYWMSDIMCIVTRATPSFHRSLACTDALKSNVGHCTDFLEHRSITTLGRCVQKSPHRDHVLNMLSIGMEVPPSLCFLILVTIVCFLCPIMVMGRW